jgi:hypothetical protein
MIPLALYLSVGSAAYAAHHSENLYLSLASARSTVCTTYAGAFDAYAKAVIYENGAYRAMCLPEDGQEALALSMRENERSGIYPLWDDGLSVLADRSEGYYIYNIERVGENAYEAILALSVSGTPEREYPGINEICVATQRICAYKENGRWVVSALGSFEFNMSADRNLGWGCEAISGKLYVGEANNMRAELVVQTVSVSGIEAKGGVPVHDAKFEDTRYTHRFYLYHTGTQEERDGISQVGVSLAPVYEGDGRPELPEAAHGDFSSSNTGGGFRISSLKKAGWGPSALRGGGGSGFYGDVYGYKYPHMYAADLYINAEIVGAIDMYPTEGGKND